MRCVVDDGTLRFEKAYYILCALAFLVMLNEQASSAVLPLYAGQLGAREVVVGIVISCSFVSRTLLEIPAGYISDRVGYRAPLIAGFVSSALAAVLSMLAADPFHLMVGRVLWGVGMALFFNTSMNLIVAMFESRFRGEAMGVFQGITFIGGFMGAPIGGILAAFYGFRMIFAVAAALMLIAAIMSTVSKGLYDTASPKSIKTEKRKAETGTWRNALDAMRNPAFGFVCVTGFLIFSTEIGILSTIIPIYFNTVLGFDIAAIGILIGIRYVGVSGGNFISGRAAKAAGKPRVYAASLLLLGVTLLMMPFFPSLGIQAALFLLSGLALGILLPLLPVTVAEVVSPSVRGTAIGVYRTFFDAGAIVAPIFLTWISVVWTTEASLYAIAALLFMNALVSLTFRGRIE